MTDLTLLSSRQREVAELVADGLTDKDIECRLVIGFGTVRAHLNAIADKLSLDRTKSLRVQISSAVLAARYERSA